MRVRTMWMGDYDRMILVELTENGKDVTYRILAEAPIGD